MSRVAIDLGFIQIYWYSIMIAIALLVGLTVILFEAKKKKISEDFFVLQHELHQIDDTPLERLAFDSCLTDEVVGHASHPLRHTESAMKMDMIAPSPNATVPIGGSLKTRMSTTVSMAMSAIATSA